MRLGDVLVAVFYLAGGRVESLARLQAVMYMLHRETPLVNTYFETWYTAPWSEDVEREVEELARDGSLSAAVDEETGLETYVASRQLMERGAEMYRKIKERDPYAAHVMRLVVAYGASLPLGRLLPAVRLIYPETARSGMQRVGLPCTVRKA